MAESFNSVLNGIHSMPVNAIVSFTFYRLVAWFNEGHSQAMALQSNNQKWAPKPKKHLDKAKERAATHDVNCFDHNTGKYQVTERGGTTSDGEVHQGVILWYLVISHADVAKLGSTTFLVLIMLQHLSIATLPTRPRYHGSSVLTALY
jgi:hypothetical protein